MRYISLFSGIEAASVAWEPLGWEPLAFCEIDEFPSGWTDVPYKGKEHPSDTPRYKACGNSMAVPVMRWIGSRIQMVDEMEVRE